MTNMYVSLEDRFWAKVDRRGPDECWPWLGMTDREGYARIRNNYARPGAYRVSYEIHVGRVPDGLILDHLCRNRACVNPAHLEPVTNRENVLRGEGITAVNARKTHCPQGHPYDSENTWFDKRGGRHCRTCSRDRQRRYYHARKQQQEGGGS